ncbi:unnamed protein product [Mesocestoides corti]|uniref:DUF7041 domain-containing protein n=1 Tax=Mesocestoides corti TaxID=53468 RepID=A0A0R3U8L5_MESCO|nr:unnamed protein product [Mesocestoides corti]
MVESLNPSHLKDEIASKIPLFHGDPQEWFAKVEAIFCEHGITSQDIMYDLVVAQLPSNVMAEAIDLNDSDHSKNYQKVKTSIITRTANRQKSCLHEDIINSKVNNNTPNNPFRETRKDSFSGGQQNSIITAKTSDLQQTENSASKLREIQIFLIRRMARREKVSSTDLMLIDYGMEKIRELLDLIKQEFNRNKRDGSNH